MKKKLSMLMVALLSIAAFATTMSLTVSNRVLGEAQDEVSPEGGTKDTKVNGTSFWINGSTNAGSGTQISPMSGKGIKVRKANPLVMTVNEGYQINSVTAYAASNDNSKTFQIAKIEVDGTEYVPNGVEMPITCAQKNASEATTIAITGIKATQNITFTFDGTNSQGIMEFHVNYTQTAVITQEITAVKLNGAEISAEDLATLKSTKSLTIDGSKLNGIGALDVTLSSGSTTVTRDIAEGDAVYTFSINNGADEFTVKVTNVAKTYTAAGSVVSYVADALSNENKTLTVDGIAFNYATKPFGYANNTPGVTLGENTYKPIKLSTGEGVSVTFPEGKKATKIIVYGWSTDGSGYMKTFKDGAEGANSIDTNDNKFYATDAAGSIYPSVYEYNVENWEALYFECAGGQPFVVMDFVFAGESATKTIYFNPGVWAESEQEASYAAWAWGDGVEGAWYAFDTEQRAFTIPETCSSILFVRYNPETQFNQLTWNDVLTQTEDLTITAGKMYEITAWTGPNGSNSTCVVKAWPPVFFNVYIAKGIQNGQVTTEPNTAEEGSTITVTATPDEGYVLDAITVTCENSNQAVQVAEDGTFTMPADNVTVNATFKDPSIVTTKTLYLKPGVWSTDNARFAARILDRQNPENNSWADFVPVTDADGYYQAEIPEDASMVRMFRFDPKTTENSEDADKFWNRTPLIENLGTNNLVKITGWGEGFDPYELATYPEQGGGDEPIVSYYVVGTMTKWQIENTFQLLPSKTEEGLYEYYGTFAANDEIKVLDDKGTWYPSGNNYVFAEAGEYVVSFRPAGNIEGWFGGYFNVAKQGGDDPQPTEPTWEKATSIAVGDVVILTAEGTTKNGDYAKELSELADKIGKVTDYKDTPAGLVELTVEAGKTEGTFAFKTADGKYLAANSSNQLPLSDAVENASSWTVAWTDGVPTITNVDQTSRVIRYNSGSPRFACYTTGQQDVTLWKKVGGGDTPEPSLVSKVKICGATDAEWKNRIDFELNSAAPEQPNVYFNTLDATNYTDDVEFKLVINDEIWRGIGEINLLDNDGLVDVTTYADGSKNFILKNSNLKYKTYNFKALWKGKEDAGSNWELEVFGQDLRSETPQPAEPVFIVVGQPQSIFGGTQEWDTKNDAHKLEEKSGKYYCTFTNVAPQEQNIQLKVYNMTNGAWFGKTVDGGENIVFNMKETGDFTVALDVNADFTEGYVWVDGDNVVFPETPDPQPTGKSFTIKFKDNGAGSSDGTAAKTEIADLIADGADYVKATAAEKAYNGKDGYGVKLSSSSANGSMTLTLAQSVKPTKITFKASAWVNGKGVADDASISINGKDAQKLTDALTEYAVDYDGETEVSEIAIAATKRAYITEVTVFYGDGGGDTPEPSLVSKVQICGATDAKWENRIDFELNSAAPEQPNVYYNTLDATNYTDDVEFKLVINDKIWKGIGEITLIDNDGLVDVTTYADGSKNFILKNSNLKYKTYNFKALWKGKEDAGSNWELEVFGQDLRSETPQPAEPVFIVVGQPQSIFGGAKEWDTENDAHKLEEKSGKYYCTFTNVAPQEQNIQLKVYNMTNGVWFGKTVDGGENIVFNMKETGDFTVALDVNADFTEGYVWVDGDNVVFPETPDPQPTGDSFTIKFKDNGVGNGDGNDAKTEIADLIADGADYVKATAAEKAYNGKEGYGVKLSSSSANGSMTLTLAQSVKPTKITFKASAWVNGKGVADAASISINGKAAQELTDELAEYAVDYDGETEVSEIAIAATKRAYITEVTVVIGGGDTPAVDTYGIVGDLTGGWEKDLMMTVSPNDANIYTASVEGVEIAEFKIYEYKLRANKSWQGYQIPTGGNLTWKPEAVGVYTFTFTANIAENTLTVDAQKTADLEIIANTPETALTVAQAIELVGKTDATVLAKEYNKVYVKGTATDIGTVNEKYHSLTYYLTDGENKIQIYSGKYLKGADFDQDKADALKDKVVTVYGNLKLFNGTPEVDMNSIIYSIEGEEPVGDTWTVAGDNETLFGTTWDPTNTANDMNSLEGIYIWEKTEVTLPAGTVQFKVVKNHSWDEAYPKDNYGLTIDEQGTYTITITFDAETKTVKAVATKTGGADLPDAEIDFVQLLGKWNDWKTEDEAGMLTLPILTKGEGNVWTGVLDLSAVTADQQFKLMINKKNWVGVDELTLVAGELVSTELGTTNNFILKNATSGYQTYDITAAWQASPNAAAGWTLTIAGKDERVEPQPVENDYSVQFVNLQGWETVNAYAYEGDQKHLGEWPGAPMTLINEQASYGGVNYPVYELKFKATAAPEFIVFNNGKENSTKDDQTEDLAFENGKRYIVLDMKGEPIATVKEPMPLDYSDKVKFYNGMPTIIWGEPSETATAKFKVGDAIHIRIVDCKNMRSPVLQLMSNDGMVELSERLATDITEVPAIVTIPVTGALYERMKDEQHKVRLCGQNVWIDRMTVEEGAYKEAATTTEENTISVWVPESEEGDEIKQDEKVEIPATSFVVSDVKEEEVVKIKASAVEPNSIIAKRRALAADDISIMKKGSSDVKLVADDAIRVSEDGYEFTVTDELATTLKTEGFDIKNNTAKNIKVKAVEVQKIPVPKYYLVGTMTDWAIKLKNELTPNNENEGQYMISLDLAADDEIKVVMSTDESTVSTWYPDAPDSNYKITESGNYTIYFRPDGKGDGDWHYGYFFVQLNEGTGIKSVKNAAALKGAQIYTISGQRVDKAQKGLYIVNGKKVVIK